MLTNSITIIWPSSPFTVIQNHDIRGHLRALERLLPKNTAPFTLSSKSLSEQGSAY